ncbi:hypothetical protein [Caloramator sp. Dgby_cultured_2]|uniref:hypothetical protein n=1 Tax=Caloramator sp. Dgby_cultured_2 TaxID=3029174 RepID=UPI00237E8E26|nr:hypothetical protein [Caloramator sp. Dgby_cultured_2]WDU82700.1 hypothetical protein PWK10_14290 [Caloramator sp. Dgby_cultured_2]
MKGIRFKLLIYTSLLLTLLLLANYLLQGNLITRFYSINERNKLINYAKEVSEYYPEDIIKMKDAALSVARAIGGRVSIFDKKEI